MSDPGKEYTDLMNAYEKKPDPSAGRRSFADAWSRALSLAIDAKDKAVSHVGGPATEMAARLHETAVLFAQAPGERDDKSGILKNPPAAFARQAGGFCRACGAKAQSAARFCPGCGAKLG